MHSFAHRYVCQPPKQAPRLSARGAWAAGILALAAVTIFLPVTAFAQDAGQSLSATIDQACANHGAALKWIAGIAGTSVLASLIANFRRKLPPLLVKLLDLAALNFVRALKTAAEQAPKAAPLFILGLALFMGGCQITGNVQADTAANIAAMQAFAPKVEAANAQALAQIQAFNAGALTDALAVGKAACADVAVLNAAYQAAQTAVTAALSADPKVLAGFEAAQLTVKLGCATIDAADPANPPATLANAVTSVVQALPQIQAALNAPLAAAVPAAPVAPVVPVAPATN